MRKRIHTKPHSWFLPMRTDRNISEKEHAGKMLPQPIRTGTIIKHTTAPHTPPNRFGTTTSFQQAKLLQRQGFSRSANKTSLLVNATLSSSNKLEARHSLIGAFACGTLGWHTAGLKLPSFSGA